MSPVTFLYLMEPQWLPDLPAVLPLGLLSKRLWYNQGEV